MDLQEIIDRKRCLEVDISNLIKEFESKTSTRINDIFLIEHYGRMRASEEKSIEVKIQNPFPEKKLDKIKHYENNQI